MRPLRRARTASPAAGPAAERGAAAVEFALVSTLLFPLLFGIVDYGLWFSDTLSARHGVHEAARAGVVQKATCSSGATGLQRIACAATSQVGAVGGPTYAVAKAPQGWARGKPLLVCVIVKEEGVTGITPLPSDRMIRAKAELAIEVDLPALTPSPTTLGSSALTGPAGTDWSWCA